MLSLLYIHNWKDVLTIGDVYMKRIVVLGGGTAGLLVLNRLHKKLWKKILHDEVELVLIEPNEWHYYQPGFLFLPLNMLEVDEIRKPVSELIPEGVKWIKKPASRIDAENNMVLVDGKTINYDYLVIATGSKLDYNYIDGLKEGTYNFYGPEEAILMREAIRRFEGGKIVVGVAGIPYKCPPAPIEMALLLDSYFKRLGNRDKVEIRYLYPLARVFPIQGVADILEPIMRDRGIDFNLFFNVERVDPYKKIIYSLEGEEVRYDLAILIPPHKGADVIIGSGLGDSGGWVPTDRYTLNMEGYDNVYVVGDATNLPISKAGSVADFEAEVVVRRIADQVAGYEPTATYDGKVMCFVLTGIGEATLLTFNYYNPPRPAKPSRLNYWLKWMYNKLYWSMTLRSELMEVTA